MRGGNELDSQQSELKELRGLVQALAVQIGRIEGVLSRQTGLEAAVTDHGLQIAGIQTWRTEHDRQQAKQAARWAALSAFAGGLIMKLIDWAHAQFSSITGHAGH